MADRPVDVVASALADAEAATGIPMQVELGEFGTILGYDTDWTAISRMALAALTTPERVAEMERVVADAKLGGFRTSIGEVTARVAVAAIVEWLKGNRP